MSRYTLTHVARPWTMNMDSSGRSNRWSKGERVREWRGVFHLLAIEQKIPALHAVTVTVVHETATRRIVDTVACAPAAKAAIDGLVDAGLWPDDGPSFVTDVTFRPPRCTGRDALTLILMEVDAAITPDTTGPRALR